VKDGGIVKNVIVGHTFLKTNYVVDVMRKKTKRRKMSPEPNFHIVIPARYSSNRFPGKPLALINGKPMLQHVVEVAQRTSAKSITVATDSPLIANFCENIKVQCLVTNEFCESGTDRLAIVCQELGWKNNEIVVNLQGDEPLMPPSLITQVAQELEYFNGIDCEIATLYTHTKDVNNPNDVKVVTDQYGNAMYFSRCPIPYGATKVKRHIGIYAYRVGFLLNFRHMPMCGLEKVEHLEQLRAMYHGAKIRIEEALEIPGPDVNTPEDIEKVEKALNND